MVLYNFPFKMKIAGEIVFPTVARLPEWATNAAYRNAVAMPGKPEISVVGPFSEAGLGKALEFPDAPETIDWDSIMSWVKDIAPIEEEQIVEWMQTAAAANVICGKFVDEYKRAGSLVIARSGDPYIPGVKAEDLKFVSERGMTVANRGYGVVSTPTGNFNVPVPGKATGIFKNILAWGAILESFIIQWTGVLMKFRELVTNPQNRISFPSFRGLTAPVFLTHTSSIPAPVNIAEFSISTNKPQTVVLRARNVDDYRDVLFEDKDSITLREGQNVIQYPIFGFPVVPAMVIELAPEDNTKTILDYWTVTP